MSACVKGAASGMISNREARADATETQREARADEPGVQWLNRIASLNAVDAVDDNADSMRLRQSRAYVRGAAANICVAICQFVACREGVNAGGRPPAAAAAGCSQAQTPPGAAGRVSPLTVRSDVHLSPKTKKARILART